MTYEQKVNQQSKDLLTPAFLMICATLFVLLLGCGGGSSSEEPLPIVNNDPEPDPIVIDTFVIDIPTVSFTADFHHNGMLHQSELANGQFFLKNLEDNERTSLGTLYEQSADITFIEGEYQLEYFHQFGDGLPKNFPALLDQSFSLVDTTYEIFNVQSVTVGFNVQLNSQEFPSGEGNEASIWLRSVDGGSEIYLGNTSQASIETQVVPGEYNVFYRYISGEDIPINQEFQLPNVVEIDSSTTLEIELESIDIRARFNTKEFENLFDEENIANFYIKSETTGLPTLIGSSSDSIVSAKLIPGEYELIYDYQEGVNIPINQMTTIETLVVKDGQTVIEPVVSLVTLEGSYSYNGQIPSSSPYDNANLELLDLATNQRYFIGQTRELSYQALHLLSGEYQVIYSHRQGDELPKNKDAIITSGLALHESQRLDIAIQSIILQPSFTLNGEAFSTSPYSRSEIYLQRQNEQPVFIGHTNRPADPVVIIPGDYQVVYKNKQVIDIPLNDNFVLDTTYSVMESSDLAINFESTSIRIETTINGEPAPTSPYDSGLMILANQSEMFDIGFTREPVDLILLKGTYDVYYKRNQYAALLPLNTQKKIATITVD